MGEALTLRSSAAKWLLCFWALQFANARNSVLWASFLSLNPLIREQFLQVIRDKYLEKTALRSATKLANFSSCVILFFAVWKDNEIPKDYMTVFLLSVYYSELRPKPRTSKIPRSAKSFNLSHSLHASNQLQLSNPAKISHSLMSQSMSLPSMSDSMSESISDLNPLSQSFLADPLSDSESMFGKVIGFLRKKKDKLGFPILFGMILANYLTPTRRGVRPRYVSNDLKKHILDPIWVNYALGVGEFHINAYGMFKSYLRLNLLICLLVAFSSFREEFIDRLKIFQLQAMDRNQRLKKSLKSYLAYILHRGNSFTNLIYVPNLLAMFLVTVSAPLFPFIALRLGATAKKYYFKNYKLVFALLFNVIGFVSAYAYLYGNSKILIPDVGYQKRRLGNIRQVSGSFLDALNLYLLRMVALTSWRSAKDTDKSSLLLVWHALEAVGMCYSVDRFLNLGSYLNRAPMTPAVDRTKKHYLIRIVNRIIS